MIDNQELAVALWSLFRAEIATGEPVFFCFTQDALKEKLDAKGLGEVSPLEMICTAARSCYDIDGIYVSLRPGALAQGSCGVSMAIILVCQQVLAVEEMVRMGGRYSENAYFPRLRALMDTELPELSADPYRFHDFEAIWRTFAREIRSIPGSSDETITFQFGVFSGFNKARSFPLSQALLSRADLSELIRQCRLEFLQSDSVGNVWVEIRRERNHLSRRGQGIINAGFLRERIVEQVQKYARRISIAEPLESGTSIQRPDQCELAISLDVIDWIHEEYTAFLIANDTSRRIDDSRWIRDKLSALLSSRGYVLSTLGEFGDYWLVRDGVVEVSPGETVLLIGSEAGIRAGIDLLGGLISSVTIDESRIRSLGRAANIRVCPVTLQTNLPCGITVRDGHVRQDDSATPSLGDYTWLGGICVNARSRKYLKEALPYGVRFGNQEYRIDELIGVNEIGMSWEAFERAIQKLETESVYDLRFPNRYVARLSIGVQRKSATEKMGFLLDSKGLLSPTLERLAESDSGVIGFSGLVNGLPKPASTRALANLLQDLKHRQGRRLTKQESTVVMSRVSASSAPENVKRVIRELLGRDATVCEATLNDFLHNRQ